MHREWRNQFWHSLGEGAGKRCSECGPIPDMQCTAAKIPTQRTSGKSEPASPRVLSWQIWLTCLTPSGLGRGGLLAGPRSQEVGEAGGYS